MAGNKVTDISKLDYTNIRQSLKEFLQSQEEFVDYDFDGSGISVLVDLLAHNTHYNALLAHLNMGETFLDSAQVRANVVSHAQLIGYVPRSITASTVIVDVVVQGAAESPSSTIIPTGYKFSGNINNNEYIFVVVDPQNAVKLTDNTYRFFNVEAKEGSLRTETYRRDGIQPFQKFQISSSTVDTSTLIVKVYDTQTTELFEEYYRYDDIAEINVDSPAFFIKENSFGLYEIYFGDNNIGKSPPNGSKIEISYIETNGVVGNNVPSVSANGTIGGLTDIAVSYVSGVTMSYGGKAPESNDSIKYNAPVNYGTQNRAVTANDYKNLILNAFPSIKDISVWGGEDAKPPVYGKVFVSPSLFSGTNVTESLSDSIVQFLKTKNVGAITPEVVDAEYNYIEIDARFKYNAKITNSSKAQIEEGVNQAIQSYADLSLNTFDGVLRFSKLLRAIDDSDQSITSSIVYTRIYKEITPDPLNSIDYIVEFPCALFNTSTVGENVVTSDLFFIDGVLSFIKDEALDDGSFDRRIFIVDAATGIKLPKYTDIGYADISAGVVYINNIKFDLSNNINIYAKPDAFDISPKYNQIVRIKDEDITVSGDLDTIAAYDLAGLASYTAFNRHGDE